jgi:hypothetical protein
MKINQSLNLKIKEKTERDQLDYKTIKNIIQNEFYDSCEKILIENQSKFIEDYFTKIILIIKNVYGEDIFQNNKSLNKFINQGKIYFIKNIYNPMFILCSLAIKYFNTNNIKDNNKKVKIAFLSNFRPHCMNADNNNNSISNLNTALHICGGKFIIIKEYTNINNNNISNINVNSNSNIHKHSYIICTKCKKCYFPNSIPMICSLCYSFYYSEIIPKNIKKNNCYLATWSKYHCKNINNEKMSCIKCGEEFWLRNNKLFCKKCKFEIEPNNIIWTCLICYTDFHSDAKIYNPLEFKEAQLILKNALLYKKIVKPIELPCKCISNQNQIDQMNFYHKIKSNISKKECKGLLYYYEINNKKFIVCSLCYNIYTINKFKWNCPLCSKSFTTLNIKLYHLKEKKSTNSNNNNYYNYKNIMIKKNLKNQSFKNTSKKKTNTISIFELNNSYSSNNNHKILKINNPNDENKYISPNKNNIINCNIKSVNSYIKKQPKDINRMSSCYSSSSKDLLIKSNNNRINDIILSNNRSITNNNSLNATNINKKRKNNTINNGCLYSLNIKKRRNLSEIPNEIKNDIYYLVAKNNKINNKNSGTGSTIFSSLSNHNLSSPKESIIKGNLELNLNNNNKLNMKKVDNNPINNKKVVNNNYNLHKNKKININIDKKVFYYKNNKRNILICNNKYYNQNNKNNSNIINNENILKNESIEINKINNINTINNEFKSKNNDNNLLSSKDIKKAEQFSDYTKENIFQKKLNKKQKGNKSFYIKEKKFILFSPENELKINNNKYDKNKRNTNYITNNIFKLNENQLELKQQQIPVNNSNNNSKNMKNHRNNISKKLEENDYFNYCSNNNYENNKNKTKNNYSNYYSNYGSKFYINYNNSINSDYNIKRNKNISFEKMNRYKIKNYNININKYI